MSKRPRRPTLDWSNEDAVFRQVQRELEADQLEQERQGALITMRLSDTFPDFKRPASLDWWQRRVPVKRKRGRPPMTPVQRRAKNPVHDAANLVPQIKATLRQAFPDRDINDRAYAYAARLSGINTPGAVRLVRNYWLASSKQRRKPPTI
jgi:hypothetical protein